MFHANLDAMDPHPAAIVKGGKRELRGSGERELKMKGGGAKKG